MENTIEITVFQFFDNLPLNTSTEHCLKMLMDLDCPYQNGGKTLYCTCQYIPGIISKNTKKLVVTVALWKYYRFYCLSIVWKTSTEHCL